MKVKFKQGCRVAFDEVGYHQEQVNVGDVADLRDEQAKSLIRDGLAEAAPKEAPITVGLQREPKKIGKARARSQSAE